MDWNWPRLVNTCGRPNSGNGQYWAAASKRGEVRVWEEEGHTLRWNWQAHTDTTYALAFNPDGRTLASASWDRTVKLWDVASGSLLQTLTGHTDRVNKVAWSPDGRIVASCGFDNVTWGPSGELLVSGGSDGTLRWWNVQRGECVRVRGASSGIPVFTTQPTLFFMPCMYAMQRFTLCCCHCSNGAMTISLYKESLYAMGRCYCLVFRFRR